MQIVWMTTLPLKHEGVQDYADDPGKSSGLAGDVLELHMLMI